jgi:uncharacterized protein
VNTPARPPDAPGDIPPEQSLIKYPSQFPIQVLGPKVEGFEAAITHDDHHHRHES